MKTLVTHINPHLDDISAIWIFKKFHPDFKDAEIEFINASRDEALKNESGEKIYFGTGGGKYDEHKGDLEDCAASLVWKDIKAKGLAPQSEIELKALDDLIEWNRKIDLGKGSDADFGPYGVQAFIRSKNSTQEDSLKSLKLGEEILDRIYELLKKDKQSEEDWASRIEFETSFGKSVAISSKTVDRAFVRNKGFSLVLIYDPEFSSAQFFTPSFEIDLEPIYKKLVEVEPDCGWFLHQSHHMVICGSSSAPEHKTGLSFEQLIKAAKNS
ncbi:MAG TPA: hypothetical protein VJG66_04205 [Patescibacteria group bacterium]|nr:hypothetical protein [Patescibacteria group bacterium]